MPCIAASSEFFISCAFRRLLLYSKLVQVFSFLEHSACRHAGRTIAYALLRSSRLVSQRALRLRPRCLLESFESIREDFIAAKVYGKKTLLLAIRGSLRQPRNFANVEQIHRGQRERCPLRTSTTVHGICVACSLRNCRASLHAERHTERCTYGPASVRLIADRDRGRFSLEQAVCGRPVEN